MFELIMLGLFGCIFIPTVILVFKAAWGLTKIVAIILLVAAFPALIGVLMIAGGITLLLPISLICSAFAILIRCI